MSELKFLLQRVSLPEGLCAQYSAYGRLLELTPPAGFELDSWQPAPGTITSAVLVLWRAKWEPPSPADDGRVLVPGITRDGSYRSLSLEELKIVALALKQQGFSVVEDS